MVFDRLKTVIKKMLSPRIKPLSTERLLKKAKKKKITLKERQKNLFKQLQELEAEREAYHYERRSVQERVRILDDKFLKGEISAKDRDKEFRILLKTAVKLRKKLNLLDENIRKLKVQLYS